MAANIIIKKSLRTLNSIFIILFRFWPIGSSRFSPLFRKTAFSDKKKTGCRLRPSTARQVHVSFGLHVCDNFARVRSYPELRVRESYTVEVSERAAAKTSENNDESRAVTAMTGRRAQDLAKPHYRVLLSSSLFCVFFFYVIVLHNLARRKSETTVRVTRSDAFCSEKPDTRSVRSNTRRTHVVTCVTRTTMR